MISSDLPSPAEAGFAKAGNRFPLFGIMLMAVAKLAARCYLSAMTTIADLAPGEQVIVISRVLDAPRELVFKAFTDPEHISKFWGPKGTTAPICEVDLRVGGKFRVEMRGPDGAVYPCTGIYRDIAPPERIVYDSTTEDDNLCGGGLPPRAIVTMTFAEVDGKTKITIHTRLPSEAARAAAIAGGFNAGWNDSLDRLAELLGNAT